ncbi:MAG: hypothetical protein R6V28_11210 [Nitriliruptoraceae bacterium]
MNAFTRSWTLVIVALVALTLLAGPAAAQVEGLSVLAAEDTVDETTENGESESGRRPLADSPRDRLGLLLLAALVIGGGAALANGRRQLKGERPQASGEFRWR